MSNEANRTYTNLLTETVKKPINPEDLRRSLLEAVMALVDLTAKTMDPSFDETSDEQNNTRDLVLDGLIEDLNTPNGSPC